MTTSWIQAIRPEQHFAEKLHALCRSRVRTSSRTKDLFDMVLFIKRGVSPESVANAMPMVFTHCNNTVVPERLPEIPEEWRSSYEQMAKDYGFEETFEQACAAVVKFYNRVFRAI